MKHRIAFYKNVDQSKLGLSGIYLLLSGHDDCDLIEQFEPKENPMSCFKAFSEEKLAPSVGDEVFYVLLSPELHFPIKCDWESLTKRLKTLLNLKDLKIQAYTEKSFNHGTFVAISEIAD